MNDTELRQRQLARLRGQPVEPLEPLANFPGPITSLVDAPDKEEQRQRLSQQTIQPENPVEEIPFVVGKRRDEYGDLCALPVPRWPSPGQPKTLDIVHAYDKERSLQMNANMALQKCVRLLAGKLRNPDRWENPYDGPPAELYAQTWAWLMGLWQGRKIEPPNELRMMAWAKQYNEEHTRKKAHGT
jgi:hypothetical protein